MQRAVGAEHAQHLTAAGRNDEGYVRMHGLALEDGSHAHHVEVAGIGAGADAHLIHLDLPGFFDGFDVIGHVRQRNHGYEFGQVDFNRFFVGGVCICCEGDEVLSPALRDEESLRHFVGGEDGGGCAKLRAHVGDGGALGDGQGLHAGAGVFHHLAHAALHAENAQQLQNNVLGSHAALQLPGQMHIDHAGAVEVVFAAAHGHGHVEAARADGNHAQRSAGGRVAVGAQQRLARLADALQLNLMADAIAGLGKVHAVLAGDGSDVFVIVRIFKARLQGVVVDISDALFGFDARDAHGLKLQIGHGAGGVLRKRLVDMDGNLAARDHFARYQMGRQDFLRYVHG